MVADLNNEEPSQQEQTPSTKVTCLLVTLTASSILSSLLYGYCNGIMSGALVYMRTDMSLNDLWQQLIVSVSLGVAAIMAFFSGFLNMRFGRKPIILASSVLFIIGSLVLAFAPSKEVLLIGRVIIGLGIGASAGTVALYVAECAPPRSRGRLLVLCELAKTCGILLAAVVAAFLSYVKDETLNWRVMLGLGAVPALVQLLGFSFMPESPRWLSLKGREEEAYSAMLRIYGGDEAAGKEAAIELNAIKAAQAKMEKEKDETGVANESEIMAILRRPPLRRALVIGCTLQSGLHLCGAMAVNFYSAIIVIMSGVQDQTLAIWITAGINVVKIPIALIGVYYVDRIGRRLLLLSSAFGLVIALSLLGLSFMLIAVQSPPAIIIENGTHPDSSCQNLRCDACSYKAECGFCFNRGMEWTSGSCVHIGDKTRWAEYGRCSHNLSSHVTDAQAVWNYGFCPSNFSWLPVVCLLLFFCAFNPGMAPMPQTITAEMFPTWARSTGCSISVTVSYTCNLLVNLTFLTIIRTLTRQGAFLLYAGITFFLFVWYYFVVPETKDQSIEHVQDLLKGSWFSRGRRQKVSFTQKNIESAQKSKQRKGVMYKPAGE